MSETEIPLLPGLPILGNMLDIDPANPVASLIRLGDQHGAIYKLYLRGVPRVFNCSYEIMNEMCDEKRFYKRPAGGLLQVRNGTGDGLFTAFMEEENWGLAHRILMPQFGPLAITRMFDEMHELACQMISKWARLGPAYRIDPVDQFTRLTLDSIALCAMDTRFNSFDRPDMHPFVEAMVDFLQESSGRAVRPAFMSDYVYRQSTKKYFENIAIMKTTGQHVIDTRRATSSDKKDLVDAMINGRDPKTGKGLSDEAIINNQLTFLIAGHETTSGLLSFLFVELTGHPLVLEKLQQEVDTVVGTGAVKIEHMNKLPYTTACIREALRLHPTAPSWEVTGLSEKDEDYPMYLGKERYKLNKGESVVHLLPATQADPAIWGEDAKEFKPERMLDEKFNKLPPNSWKPFGNGARGCIGRAFAWQEVHIVVAMLIQNFTFRAEDPSYKLEIVQSLTLKPKNFHMFAKLRPGLDPMTVERRLWDGKNAHKPSAKDKELEDATKRAVEKAPMAIYYGSNTGTCEALAQSLANTAAMRDYDPTVEALDAAADTLPKDRPVVIVSGSYEGEAPDNAARFVTWLKGVKGDVLKDVKYTVFGCGHSDWVSTYQKIPTLCDEVIAERGGKRICARGRTNVAENNIFNDFDAWCDKSFWPSIAKEYGVEERETQSHGLDIEIEGGSRTTDLRQDVGEGVVQAIKVLTAPDQPVKRHIEILLPSGMTYTVGDYLAVLPINHAEIVKAVMARFSLRWDAHMSIKEGQHTALPTGRTMSVYSLLSSYVELSQTATQKNLATLALYIEDEEERAKLEATPAADISGKHISVLDLLQEYPSCKLPFGDYLAMLPPLRLRQYSISSSPLANSTTLTLTYSVLDAPSHANQTKRYRGAASTYLSELQKGDRICVAVRPSSKAFHLPLDVGKVPIIMVCAGTGLAPFRAFAMERALQIKAGRKLAPAMLFVGCRHPDRDLLYKDEFEEWQKIGAVDVRYAFSQKAEASEGCKYVQDRLWKDRVEARELWDAGARFFVCGSGRVGECVGDVCRRTYTERAEELGKAKTDEEVKAWWDGVKEERFASDVFD